MERREIVGILLIAIVASTIVTYHIQRGSETPFELLEEKIPGAIPPGEKTIHELTFSLVLRQGVESLIWDFDSLANATSKEGDPIENVERAVETNIGLLDGIGAPYVKVDLDVEGGKGVLYDFSDTFSKLAPETAVLSATTIYSLVEVDGYSWAFRGVSDFFPNRNRSLASLTFSRNEVPETYLTEQAGEAQAQGKPSVMKAPILGRSEYDDVAEDDRISVRLVVNSIGVPGHAGMMQVLRIYANTIPEVSQGYLIR